VLDVLLNEPLVMIPSPPRHVSWLVAAYFVWVARYQDHAALFWQSETEKKAAYIVDQRCTSSRRTSTARVPQEDHHHQDEGLAGRADQLPERQLHLGGPAGGDVLRTYTATKVMMDECEFQPQAPGQSGRSCHG